MDVQEWIVNGWDGFVPGYGYCPKASMTGTALPICIAGQVRNDGAGGCLE